MAAASRHGLTLAATLMAAATLTPAGATGQAEQVLTIQTAAGPMTARALLPASPARPPVAVLVSPAATELAAALASAGIASVQITGVPAPQVVARWITLTRNDERFPTTTVFAEGAATANAVIGARAARADGVVTRDEPADAASEISRLVATRTVVPAGSPQDTARHIAEFARTVPVLGRRGTTAARPASARRSPRQVLLTTIGPVQIGLEWGSPQKRGREIWGALVRWNQVWMPGADEATTLTTNAPIQIGTLTIPAGDHTFYTLPSPDHFQLIVSHDVGQFHTVHDTSKELGRADMTAGTRSEAAEGLTFSIESREAGGVLKLAWDIREFSVPILTSSTTLTPRPRPVR